MRVLLCVSILVCLTVAFVSDCSDILQSATCRIRNTFGGAELFETNLVFGTKTRFAFNASLTAPLSTDLKTRGGLSVFAHERDNSAFCSAMEGSRGLKAIVRVSLGQLAFLLRHDG